MRHTSLFAAILALCAALVAAKPLISEKNGVRTLTAVSDTGAIARGSVFVVTGTDLGPVDGLKADIPYGQDLAGISVAFTTLDDSATISAYVVSASATRIVAILPSSAAAGDYKVMVTFNGEMSDPAMAKIVDRNLGILTADGNTGSGAVARIRVPDSDAVAVGYTQPLKPGQQVDVDAAGLGPIDTPDNDYPAEVNMLDGVLVVIGGVEIPATYIGRNAQKPGYDRISFVVPDSGLPAGCAVDISIRSGDAYTAKASVPVAAKPDDTACTHPLGISPGGLQTLDAGGTVTYGHFAVLQQSVKVTQYGFTLDIKTEAVGGAFERFDAAALARYMGSSAGNWLTNPTACYVVTALDADPGPPAVLVDAGVLNIQGPGGLNKDIPKTGNTNSYLLTLGSSTPSIPGLPSLPGALPGVQKGPYLLTGKGGSVVGAFSVTANVPDSIVWTNKDDGQFDNVNRGNDLTFLWTGIGNSGDMASATGYSHGPLPEDNTKIGTRTFNCYAPTTAGRIVVPASVLQQLPVTVTSDPAGFGALILQHTNGANNLTRLVAPLTDGGNTEPGTFSYAYGALKQATFK